MILLTCLSCFLNYFTLGGNRLTLSQSFYSKKDFRLQPAAISIRTLSMPPLFWYILHSIFLLNHSLGFRLSWLRQTPTAGSIKKYRVILIFENIKNNIEFFHKSSFHPFRSVAHTSLHLSLLPFLVIQTIALILYHF